MTLQPPPSHVDSKVLVVSSLPSSLETRGWYTSQNQTSSDEMIQRAYQEARVDFARVLTGDEQKRIWCSGYLSMTDVLDAVSISKKAYESKPNSKARKWLSIFSSRVVHYGGIMDVLVQHHPEYVSLAWGAMKFLFLAVMNHEESTTQIAKAFCRISEILPRTQLVLILYPTDAMREAVACLYAQIIKFTQKAVTWYKKGPLAHAWGSIARPWALNFQDNVDDIKVLSQRIDELANTAEKAEIRDIHRGMVKMRAEMSEQAENMQKLLVNNFGEILQTATESRALQQRMNLSISDQRDMIQNIQLTQILSLAFMSNLPTSGESLGYCRSIRARDRSRTSYCLPELSTLENWSSGSRSSMIFAQTHNTKSFMVDLISLIQQTKYPIIWALRFPNFWEKEPTYADILRMLVIQAVQINPSSISGPTPITTARLREASNEGDWLRILRQALTGTSQIYIVIDADLLSLASENSTYRATRMIEKFPEILAGTNVKLVVSMANIDEGYVTRHWDPNAWSKLQSPFQRRNFATSRRARRQRKLKSRSII